MNKRDTIIVVFRVAAIIIIFFGIFPELWSAVHELTILCQFMQNIWGITEIILYELLLPFLLAVLLWNKGLWIAEKILGSIETELREDNPDPTDKQFNGAQVESIVMVAIGLTIVIFSIPRVFGSLESISRYTYFSFDVVLHYHIIPLSKLIIGIWLVLRSRKVWRKARLQD